MKRQFRIAPFTPPASRPVFGNNYEPSLSRDMLHPRDGEWVACGKPVSLDSFLPRATHYLPEYVLANGKAIAPPGKIVQWREVQRDGVCQCACQVHGPEDDQLWLYKSSDTVDEQECLATFAHRKITFDFVDGTLRWSLEPSMPAVSTETPLCAPREFAAAFDYNVVPCGDLKTLVLSPKAKNASLPAVVVCLGGPFIGVPEVWKKDSIYQLFLNAGYAVVIPLRRGVQGVKAGWEEALEGHYGVADVEDIMAGTRAAIEAFPFIDKTRVGIYGASYGGYTALLAAEATAGDALFNAVCLVSSMTDPCRYPQESQGDEEEIRSTYRHAPSPLDRIGLLEAQLQIIHMVDDETVWFGQSVRLYNKLVGSGKGDGVRMTLFGGPHTMDIPNRPALEAAILTFFSASAICAPSLSCLRSSEKSGRGSVEGR